jgi:hypothetical protein
MVLFHLEFQQTSFIRYNESLTGAYIRDAATCPNVISNLSTPIHTNNLDCSRNKAPGRCTVDFHVPGGRRLSRSYSYIAVSHLSLFDLSDLQTTRVAGDGPGGSSGSRFQGQATSTSAPPSRAKGPFCPVEPLIRMNCMHALQEWHAFALHYCRRV